MIWISLGAAVVALAVNIWEHFRVRRIYRKIQENDRKIWGDP